MVDVELHSHQHEHVTPIRGSGSTKYSDSANSVCSLADLNQLSVSAPPRADPSKDRARGDAAAQHRR